MAKRSLDCVALKDRLQRRASKELGNLQPEERVRVVEAEVLADPILGPWYRTLLTRRRRATRAA